MTKEEAKARAELYRNNNREKLRENGRKRYHDPRVKKESKEYRDRPEVKKRTREWVLLKKYGLTQSAFDAMLLGQGSVCAICGSDKWGKHGPHVDHDHETGLVRGILCHFCNISIGQLRHNPKILRSAADYLDKK